MDLSIIIVNYNVKEFLQNLIDSIYKAAKNYSFEIIIVDNCSTDGSQDYIQNKFPDVNLILNQKNLGFSKANNIGLKQAKGKYLLLLNPDTLLSEDTISTMLNFFSNTPDAGLAGCKILNPDGTLQLACRRSFPGPWTSFCKVTGLSNLFPKSRLFARYNLTFLDENKTYEVDAISGSFMMMKREVYEKIGGFDEQFFMYGEDLDLCYRVQSGGYKVYYVHNAQIIHYKGESTKRSSIDEAKVFYDAMHLFVRKHLSSSFIIEIILQSAILIRRALAFIGKKKLVFLSALADFVIFDLCLLLAAKIYETFGGFHGFPEYSLRIILFVPAIIQVIIGLLLGAYKKDSISVLKSIISLIVGFFILSAVTFFFKQFAYSRAIMILLYVLLFISFSLWRIILKLFFKVGISSKDFLGRKTLIVGINDNSIHIAKKLQNKSTDIHNIIGLISSTYKDIGIQRENFKVIGSVENILKVINENKVNEVIFTPEEISYNDMMSIVSKCQSGNIEFKLIGSALDFIVGKTSISILDDVPLIELNYNISEPMFKIIKRAFDLTVSFAVLFLIYPFIYFKVKMSGSPNGLQNFILQIPEVFSGKMSFVGPNNPDYHSDLYLGKKGLTGLWFIEDDENIDKNKLDLVYAKNQNLWLDLEILGKTLNKLWREK